MKLGAIDITILVIYFISQIAIGLYVGRKNRSTNQYFLAGKSFSGLIVGISFIGSVISSSTFLAMPADAFKTAWLRFVPNLAFPIAVLIAAWLFIPFFRRGTVTSAYQYLALRFGNSISAYASIVFIITQILRTSMIAYLLSLLVGEITGWGFTNSLLLIVGVTALYTVKGGIKAVIWTDVVQTFVLLIGGLACVVYALWNIPGGLVGVFSDGIVHHKFSFYDMNSDGVLAPTKWFGQLSEKTVFMIFMVGCMQFLNVQFDQSTVQRWCTTKTAREARKSMYVMCLGCIPVWAMFQFTGVCLFVFFLHHPDPVASEILSGVRKAELILPHFINSYLSGGLAGLVIAGAFAAGMSTLSACINVSSMVSIDDIYKKYINKEASDSRSLFLGKASSLSLAVIMTAGALFIYKSNMLTLTDFMLTAGVVITTGIPSVFIAGMFIRMVNITAIWVGVVSALIFMIWVIMSNNIIIPEYLRIAIPSYYVSIVGNLLALFSAFLTSLFLKPKQRDLTNLTVWDQSKTALE